MMHRCMSTDAGRRLRTDRCRRSGASEAQCALRRGSPHTRASPPSDPTGRRDTRPIGMRRPERSTRGKTRGHTQRSAHEFAAISCGLLARARRELWTSVEYVRGWIAAIDESRDTRARYQIARGSRIGQLASDALGRTNAGSLARERLERAESQKSLRGESRSGSAWTSPMRPNRARSSGVSRKRFSRSPT